MKSTTKPLKDVPVDIIHRTVSLLGSKRLLMSYLKYPVENQVQIKLGSFNRFLRPIEFSFVLKAQFKEEGINELDERHVSYLIELISKNSILVKDIKTFVSRVGYDWTKLPSLKEIIRFQPFSEVGRMSYKYPLDVLLFRPYNQPLITRIRKALFKSNIELFISKKIDKCISHFLDTSSLQNIDDIREFIRDKITVSNYCYIFEPIKAKTLINHMEQNDSYQDFTVINNEDFLFDLSKSPLLQI